jgi:hypothetical protein
VKSLQICLAAALFALLGAGCSGDDKKAAATPADSCNAYCDAVSGCDAGGIVIPVEECKQLCSALSSASAGCQASAQTYFQCMTAGDACTAECTDQEEKMNTDCASG